MFKLNNTNIYPKVFIPDKIIEAKGAVPTFDEFIELYGINKPLPPKKTFPPKEPSKTKVVNQSTVVVKRNVGCFHWFVVIGLTGPLISTFNEKGWPLQASFMIVILIVIIIWFCTFEFQNLNVDVPLTNEEYLLKLNEFDNQQKLYLKQQEKYNHDLKNFHRENETLKEMFKNDFNEISERFFLNKLKSFSYPLRPDCIVNRGKHDTRFKDVLSNYFPERIGMDLLLEDSGNSFMPDIIYFDKKTLLHIDIEIDEPYVKSSNKPTHFTDQDHYRDEYFLSYNWIVVRFAEKQIVNQPQECCDLIKSVIDHVFNRSAIINKVVVENQWSFDDALLMAQNNYRRTYLGYGGIFS